MVKKTPGRIARGIASLKIQAPKRARCPVWFW